MKIHIISEVLQALNLRRYQFIGFEFSEMIYFYKVFEEKNYTFWDNLTRPTLIRAVFRKSDSDLTFDTE
jgi:hypothetical protein